MRTAAWVQSIVGGLVIIVGGPMLVQYVQPTEEELFKRYNPELQKRSLEGRDQRLQEANEFIDKIKEYSKSDKPIWTVMKEEELKAKKKKLQDELAAKAEKQSIQDEIRRQRMEGSK